MLHPVFDHRQTVSVVAISLRLSAHCVAHVRYMFYAPSPVESCMKGSVEDVPPQRNLFLFARPSPAVKREIAWLRDFPGLVRAPVSDDRLHMTMGILGSFDQEIVRRVTERLNSFILPSFRVIMDTIITTPEQVLLQASEALIGYDSVQSLLVLLVDDILKDYGVNSREWTRRCKPHLTLGYKSSWSVQRAIEPISWTVGQLDLVESQHGRPIHVVHKSWALTPGA